MTKARDTADINSGTNTAAGEDALENNTASNNTAVGFQAAYSNTTGTRNVSLGDSALFSNTTASYNTALGFRGLYSNTTGASNVGLGYQALDANTTGSNNVAIGRDALVYNTTASNNTAVGYRASHDNTTGTRNVSMGKDAMYQTTTGNDLVGIGYEALTRNTTGANNVAIGKETLSRNTTGNHNVAVGYEAGYSNTTGTNNTVVGRDAGYSNQTADGNVFIGEYAGRNTTNSNNTFLGTSSGWQVTSGQKNTILGRYNGNQGGLDIRTSSNNIVLSDGDGNPRGIFTDSGHFLVGQTSANATTLGFSVRYQGTVVNTVDSQAALELRRTGTGAAGSIALFRYASSIVGSIAVDTNSTAYNTSSDYRLKENVNYTWDATTRLKQLKPARFNFISDADTTVDGFLAHEAQAVVPECVTGAKDAVDADGNPEYQGIDQSKLVPLLVKTIQELEARITALEGA